VDVPANGWVNFQVNGMDAVALHVGAVVGNGSGCTPAATTFHVEATTYWGQDVYVVGNTAELGNWNTGSAVALSPATYPIWSGTVNLPPETSIEFKYIKKDGGTVVWESGSNRLLTTGCGGSSSTHDTWRN
ncbi:MAG: CBM20 domain-containing protein, partial [Chloroflexota bacterium]